MLTAKLHSSISRNYFGLLRLRSQSVIDLTSASYYMARVIILDSHNIAGRCIALLRNTSLNGRKCFIWFVEELSLPFSLTLSLNDSQI